MAAFVHRGFSRVGWATRGRWEYRNPRGSAFIDLAVLKIAVGGVAGGNQFVKLDAVVRTANLDNNTGQYVGAVPGGTHVFPDVIPACLTAAMSP